MRGRPETRPWTRAMRSAQGPRPGGRALDAGRSGPSRPAWPVRARSATEKARAWAATSARRPFRPDTSRCPLLRCDPQGLATRLAQANQWIDRSGMEPMPAEIHRVAAQHRGKQPTADPIARLQHRHRDAPLRKGPRRGDAGGACADHDHIRVVGQRCEARRDALPQVAVGGTGCGDHAEGCFRGMSVIGEAGESGW